MLVVADEELAAQDAAGAAKAGAVIVIGTTLPAWARHAAAVVLPIANCRRGRRNLHQPARPRAAVHAGEGGAGIRAAELVRARRSARRDRAKADRYSLASEVFAALAAAQPEFAGMTYDTLGLKGAMVAGAMAGASA